MMPEEWRDVVGLEESYAISNMGRVWKRPSVDSLGRQCPPRSMSAHLSGRYMRVRMTTPEGRKVERGLHVMVLEAFVGPRPTGLQGCHNDGNVRNNQLENLRWDTCSANNLDKLAHGTMPLGRRNVAAKLTEKQAAKVKALRVAGVPTHVLARLHGVNRETIGRITRGKWWRHVNAAVLSPGEVQRAHELQVEAQKQRRAKKAAKRAEVVALQGLVAP